MDLRNLIEQEIEEVFEHLFSFSTPDEIDHIIKISESIIRTRDNIHPEGGGFVKALVDNDLSLAVQKADPSCMKYLKFLVHVKDNVNLDENHELKSLYQKAKNIFNSNLEWSVKYDQIFSEQISDRIYKLTNLHYYNPDTSYEEDLRAFMSALENKINELN